MTKRLKENDLRDIKMLPAAALAVGNTSTGDPGTCKGRQYWNDGKGYRLCRITSAVTNAAGKCMVFTTGDKPDGDAEVCNAKGVSYVAGFVPDTLTAITANSYVLLQNSGPADVRATTGANVAVGANLGASTADGLVAAITATTVAGNMADVCFIATQTRSSTAAQSTLLGGIIRGIV